MWRLFVLVIILLFLPFFQSRADVLLNEVFFDPSGTDTGLEWIEIYNSGENLVNLSGWQLYPDGIGYFSFPQGFMLNPKGFLILHLRAQGTDSETRLYHSSPSTNMGNTSGSVALFSGEPRGKDTIKSFLQWGKAGETWETDAENAGLWIKGEFIDLAGFNEGGSVALKVDGDKSAKKNAWHILSTPTAGLSNASIQESSGSSPSSSTAPPPFVASTSPPPSPEPRISAYAGMDQRVMVGVYSYFSGYGRGFNGEELQNARFWWNYGDGETREGRSVSHIFRIPGSYTVGLHISSGSYAASDYLKVEVIPNKIEISRVIVGKDGFLEFSNPSDLDTDIGGWIFEDKEGKRFNVPPKTIVGGGAKVSFTNTVTGLLLNPHSLPLAVYYPNGVILMKRELMEEKFEEVKPKVVLAEKIKDLSNVSFSAEVRPAELPERKSEKKDEYMPEEHKEAASVYSSSSRSTAFFLLSLTFGILISLGFLAAKHIRL